MSPGPADTPTWDVVGDLFVGIGGEGTLTIGADGKVTNGLGFVGYSEESTGTVEVSGTDARWLNISHLFVGFDGIGTLTIGAGATVTNTFGVVGNSETSTGTVEVSGTDARWENDGDLTVGEAGTGTLTIGAGATVTNSFGFVGDSAGSTGIVTVSGVGARWENTGFLAIGESGTGTLTIGAGATVTNAGSVVGNSETSTGVVTVSGAGARWQNDGGLYVGGFGIGALTIGAGATVTSAGSVVGRDSNSTGTVTVSGAGALLENGGDLYVGGEGNGMLTIADNGKVSSPTAWIGGDASPSVGGEGTINIGAAPTDPGGPVGAGVLSTPTLQFGAGAGTLNFNHTGTDYVFSTALKSVGAGTHALNHYAGTTLLTGDSSGFTGTTTVSGGQLIVGQGGTGALGGGLNIQSGGLLGGSGDLGSTGSTVTIAPGAVHAPGNSIAVQHVLGNYANHGTLRIEATPSETDQITVAGNVDITNASLDLVLSPNNAASWDLLNGPFTLIDKQSAGAVTGSFVEPATRNLLFLNTLLDYAGGDGNDVTLALERNTLDFASVGQTRNQRATGAAIDTLGTGNPVWNAVALMTDENVVRAGFDALSGDSHASAKSALIEDSHFLRDAMNDRLRGAFQGVGASSAPVLTYGAGGASQAPASTGRFAAWGTAFGSWGSIDGDGNAAGLDTSTGGFFTGIDGLINDKVRLGAMAGYSHTRFDADGSSSSASSDNVHLGLYGGTQWGKLGLRSGLGYTWHDIDASRSVALPGFADRLKSGYNAGTFQAFGELGYRLDTAVVSFEPYANLAYVSLKTDGYTEHGGAAALTGRGDTTATTFTTLGLRASSDFELGKANMTARGALGWRHAFGDITPTTTQAFAANGNSTFTVAGVPVAKNSAVVEAGLDMNLTKAATVGFAYQGQFGSGVQQNGLKANLAIKF